MNKPYISRDSSMPAFSISHALNIDLNRCL
jgi:phosphopantetheinyl transferase